MANRQTRTRLGIEAENMGRAPLALGMATMAQAIEAAGADSVSVSDHLVSFAPEAGARGETERSTDPVWLEALTCLAAMSSVTSRVRLVTSVVILPQRQVLELIKVAGTVDVLSQGRLVLGVGSGWNEPEMAALGYDFASRGRRMDEMLTVLRSIRDERVPPFQGEQVTVPPGVVMTPTSYPGHPIPLYIGGSGVSPVSLRRTVQFGDGWMPYSPTGRWDGAALGAALGRLRDEQDRRELPPFDSIFKLGVEGHAAPTLEREVRELADIGFDEIIVQGIWDADLEQGVEAIHRVRAALDA